jgi:hypothetical protein
VSWESESKADLAPIPAADGPPPHARWMLVGYLLGLLAMSPPLLLYYWIFAPLGPLLVAGVCVLVGSAHHRFHAIATGAAVALVFCAVTVLVFFLGLAIGS